MNESDSKITCWKERRKEKRIQVPMKLFSFLFAEQVGLHIYN